jgi:hypothetical protein
MSSATAGQRRRPGVLDGDENLDERSLAYERTVRDLLDAQRRKLVHLRGQGEIPGEVMRALTRELDLEDQRLEV